MSESPQKTFTSVAVMVQCPWIATTADLIAFASCDRVCRLDVGRRDTALTSSSFLAVLPSRVEYNTKVKKGCGPRYFIPIILDLNFLYSLLPDVDMGFLR